MLMINRPPGRSFARIARSAFAISASSSRCGIALSHEITTSKSPGTQSRCAEVGDAEGKVGAQSSGLGASSLDRALADIGAVDSVAAKGQADRLRPDTA